MGKIFKFSDKKKLQIKVRDKLQSIILAVFLKIMDNTNSDAQRQGCDTLWVV